MIAVENFDWNIRARQMVAAYSKFISNYSGFYGRIKYPIIFREMVSIENEI